MEQRVRRKFTPEFKARTVELVRSSGRPVAQVCRELDLAETAVSDAGVPSGGVALHPPRSIKMSTQEFAVEPGWGQIKPSRWGQIRSSFPHLADARGTHPLRRQQHDLRPPPRDNRTRRAPDDPKQSIALVVGDLSKRRTRRHGDLPIEHRSGSSLLRQRRPPLQKPGKRCRPHH